MTNTQQTEADVLFTDRLAIEFFGVPYLALTESQERILAQAIIRAAVKKFDA